MGSPQCCYSIHEVSSCVEADKNQRTCYKKFVRWILIPYRQFQVVWKLKKQHLLQGIREVCSDFIQGVLSCFKKLPHKLQKNVKWAFIIYRQFQVALQF